MKLPRKIKKRIPKNTPYCYIYDEKRNKDKPCNHGGYWIKNCKYYKHIEGVEGYCKLIKYEVEDQMKSCGVSMGY